MSYSVLYSINGATSDISNFVTSIRYGGDVETAVRKLEISVVSGTDEFIPELDIKKGGLLTLFSGDNELIRAVVFKEDRDDGGNISICGYTHGIYLTKNKDTKKFEQMKASQVAASICSEFGIPMGTVEDTKIILPKLILRDKTLWDMLLIALTETTKQSGVKYRVFFKEGRLNIREKRKQYVPWVLEEGVNLISAGSSSSIEEMKNQVKVIAKLPKDNTKELVYVSKSEESQKLYGILQETFEESGDGITGSGIRQIADTKLKELCREEVEAEVEALGMEDAEAGMAVYIVESAAGLTGSFYIEQDDHSIEGNKHSMKLNLSLTDETPSLEYEPPQ